MIETDCILSFVLFSYIKILKKKKKKKPCANLVGKAVFNLSCIPAPIEWFNDLFITTWKYLTTL
jgi:hypothetical protein